MPTYITLGSFTQKGIENIKEGPSRLEEAKKTFKAMGAKIKDFYLVTGKYDMVVIVEAPDDETIAKLALIIGSKGTSRTVTLRAFTEDEYRKIFMDESLRQSTISAMELAWRDHHHARNQTWKALQIEFLIAAAVVGVNWSITSIALGLASGLLLLITTLCGIQITLRHRNNVEITKFRHIMNCEEALGLRQDGLIDGVAPPKSIKFIEAFFPWKGNTALFILRMHIAILLFSGLFLFWRVVSQ